MAEDDIVIIDDDDDYIADQAFIVGEQDGEKEKKDKPKKKSRCNPRLDELARPRKWALLGLWKSFAETFDPERKQALRIRIQEEFSMTPEETEKYVASLRKPGDGGKRRSEQLKEKRKEKMIAEKEAKYLFKKALKRGMLYACTHVAPPLVSPMLRYMSESILVLLSDIHNIQMPKRCDKTHLGQFLIALADWCALYLSNIYYEVAFEEKIELVNKELNDAEDEEIEEAEEGKEKPEEDDQNKTLEQELEPNAHSTPVSSKTDIEDSIIVISDDDHE